MSVASFNDLMAHVGHNVVVDTFNDQNGTGHVCNVAILCEDCQEVLLDFDISDEGDRD